MQKIKNRSKLIHLEVSFMKSWTLAIEFKRKKMAFKSDRYIERESAHHRQVRPRGIEWFRRHAMHPSPTQDVQERDVTPDPPPVARSVRNSAGHRSVITPRVTSLGCSSLSETQRRFLPPDRRTNRLSRRCPEILPRLHSGIMREPSARRGVSRTTRAPLVRELWPRRWLPIRRDRSVTIGTGTYLVCQITIEERNLAQLCNCATVEVWKILCLSQFRNKFNQFFFLRDISSF